MVRACVRDSFFTAQVSSFSANAGGVSGVYLRNQGVRRLCMSITMWAPTRLEDALNLFVYCHVLFQPR